MKRSIILVMAAVLAGGAALGAAAAEDEAAIKAVVLSAYRDGLCNVGDIELVRKGFHPEFRLLGLKDGALTVLPIADWIKRTEERKTAGKFPPPELVAFEFLLVDICGDAAVVKVKFMVGARHVYTDYLSLYRLADGWKIVGKIYASHGN
jgi:hypothetical protein